jgi:MFS transporter, DHA1 family, tetracycline resistance protein
LRFRRRGLRPNGDRAPLPGGFATIWLTVAIDLVGFGIVLPILPIYAKHFHTTAFQATLLVAAFSAASILCSPLWGRISDRVGRKPILLISLAGTAVGSLVTGLAGGLALLLVGRVVDGASGASVSVAQAAAADLSNSAPAQRARLFGLLGAAFGVGFVAGPALGSVAALGGPRLPFFLAAGIAAVNLCVAARRLPETRLPTDTPAPRRGGPLAAIAEAWRLAPLLAVAFFAMVAFSGFEATFALFGQRHLDLGIASAAAVFAGVGAVIVIVQGGLVHRCVVFFGEVPTLTGGLLLNAAGLAMLSQARSWDLAGPALLALTAGQGLAQTTMATILAGRSDPARRGGVLGAQQSATGLARVAGPVLAGALLGSRATGVPYLLGCGLSLVAAGMVVAALGRSPKPLQDTGHPTPVRGHG